jgi:low affinity Fe/Cu permease
MDDSYYGKGRWSNGRYSLLDHICDYVTPPVILAIFVIGVAVWGLCK